MNRLHIALVLFATFCVPATGAAQNSLSVAGGVAVPLGSAADLLTTGYNASVALTAKPPLAAVGVRLEGMFNSLGYQDRSTGTRSHRIMAATVNATVSDPATPLRSFYGVAGIGYYNTSVVGGPATRANNDVGFSVGLGMFLTSGVGTFMEARYHHIPSELSTTSIIPVTLGVRF